MLVYYVLQLPDPFYSILSMVKAGRFKIKVNSNRKGTEKANKAELVNSGMNYLELIHGQLIKLIYSLNTLDRVVKN